MTVDRNSLGDAITQFDVAQNKNGFDWLEAFLELLILEISFDSWQFGVKQFTAILPQALCYSN